MYTLIKLKRGTTLEREANIFQEGEPVFDTDLQRLYVGDDATYGGILIGGTESVSVSGSITKDSGDLILEGDQLLSGGETNLIYGINSSGDRAWLEPSDVANVVSVSNSIVNTNDTIELENDEESPEVSHYYGTDASGYRGYHDLTTAPLTQFNFQDPDTEYVYGDNDEITRVNFSNGRYILFSYDDNDDITYERYYESDDELIFGYAYTYDSIGRVESKEYFVTE